MSQNDDFTRGWIHIPNSRGHKIFMGFGSISLTQGGHSICGLFGGGWGGVGGAEGSRVGNGQKGLPGRVPGALTLPHRPPEGLRTWRAEGDA